MNVVISSEAITDLQYLFQYSIETFGIAKTEEYVKNIYKRISNLGTMPGIGHLHKLLPENLRVINVEKHIVIYKVIEEESKVIIVRIVHQKVNLSNII